MFEQATLSSGPAGTRAWSAFLGFTTQAAAITFAVLIPMVYPQVLPTTRIIESIGPPLPPAPRQLGETRRTTTTRAMRPVPWIPTVFHAPLTVPTRVFPVVDEMAEPAVVGAIPGPPGGSNIGVVGGFWSEMAKNVAPPAPPKPVVTPAAPPAAPPPTIVRYKQGGRVVLGPLLHRVEPPYPSLARAAHVSGVVELECVVGADGHIRDVKPKSGSPLLIRAAVDAAWQWVYGPSKLNGVPIEIITNLTFTFKLN